MDGNILVLERLKTKKFFRKSLSNRGGFFLLGVAVKRLALLLVFIFFPISVFSAKCIPPNLAPNSKIKAVVVRVVDGDTLVARARGCTFKVRLIGIDTPESRHNRRAKRQAKRMGLREKAVIELGKMAKKATLEFCPPGTEMVLEADVQVFDRYKRILAYVWLTHGEMLNEKLVREGWALVYTVPPNVKYQDRFLRAQRKARREGRGLWGRIP